MRTRVRVASLPRVGARELDLSVYWLRALVIIGAGAVVAGLVFLYLLLVSDLTIARREAARAALSVDRLEREVLYYEHQVDVTYSREELRKRAQALGMEPFPKERVTRLGEGDGPGSGG